ncbi:hypothetical protein LCGC14_3015470, partial [marine sediment metagenome]
PGPRNWWCNANNKGITSADGVNSYTNLWSLYLPYNQISSLDADQFQGLTNLEVLSLSFNQISSLGADQFQDLTNLQTLYIRGNQLSSLDANQFQGLTNLQTLLFGYNEISSLAANQFQDLTDLQVLNFDQNQISSLAANQFQGLTDLHILFLWSNQIASLDLTGFEATTLTDFSVSNNPVTKVVLADATVSQITFDTLMIGNKVYTSHIGIAELTGIASVDFTAADLTGVDRFDTMFAMADLETLILTDALFSEAIVTGGYAEVWDLISALELKRLDALTVDRQLYTAMQTNLDAWDAGANNVLTVVPEPSTLLLLTVASLALFLCRRKTASGK